MRAVDENIVPVHFLNVCNFLIILNVCNHVYIIIIYYVYTRIEMTTKNNCQYTIKRRRYVDIRRRRRQCRRTSSASREVEIYLRLKNTLQ